MEFDAVRSELAGYEDAAQRIEVPPSPVPPSPPSPLSPEDDERLPPAMSDSPVRLRVDERREYQQWRAEVSQHALKKLHARSTLVPVESEESPEASPIRQANRRRRPREWRRSREEASNSLAGVVVGRYGEMLSTASRRPGVTARGSVALWSPRSTSRHDGASAETSASHASPRPATAAATSANGHRAGAAARPKTAPLQRSADPSRRPTDDAAGDALRRAFGHKPQPTAATVLMPYVRGRSDVPVTQSVGRPLGRVRKSARPAAAAGPGASGASGPVGADASGPVSARGGSGGGRPASAYSREGGGRPLSARPQSVDSTRSSRADAQPLPTPGIGASGSHAAALLAHAPAGGGGSGAHPSRPLGAADTAVIEEREEALSAIYDLLQTIRRVRGNASRLSGRICSLFQWRMARLLSQLRSASLRVVEAAEAWRSTCADGGTRLIRMDGELRTVPEPFVHGRINYLLKMIR